MRKHEIEFEELIRIGSVKDHNSLRFLTDEENEQNIRECGKLYPQWVLYIKNILKQLFWLKKSIRSRTSIAPNLFSVFFHIKEKSGHQKFVSVSRNRMNHGTTITVSEHPWPVIIEESVLEYETRGETRMKRVWLVLYRKSWLNDRDYQILSPSTRIS